MKTTKNPTLAHAPLYLYLEAEHLSEKLEQALCDPTATSDAFFQSIDHFADVLTKLRQQAVLGVRPGAA